jgi:hypothetical protein
VRRLTHTMASDSAGAAKQISSAASFSIVPLPNMMHWQGYPEWMLNFKRRLQTLSAWPGSQSIFKTRDFIQHLQISVFWASILADSLSIRRRERATLPACFGGSLAVTWPGVEWQILGQSGRWTGNTSESQWLCNDQDTNFDTYHPRHKFRHEERSFVDREIRHKRPKTQVSTQLSTPVKTQVSTHC